MKMLICALAVVWGMVLLAEPALAQCTTHTIFLPDGRVLTCTSCTYGSQTITNCF